MIVKDNYKQGLHLPLSPLPPSPSSDYDHGIMCNIATNSLIDFKQVNKPI